VQVSDDHRLGTELAGYRIESLLGQGGMSVVYLAEDLRLRRKVALKLLAAELAEDESFRGRFLRESELAASIDHPNIVPIYEAGATADALFIAMRYVEGRDLKESLRHGRLEPGDAVSIVAQVASALDAAHARGLVHRDVKPSDVLLDLGARPDGSDHVYLADFGITKRVSDEGDDGHLLGTIDYVAPEQIAGDAIDGRADIYSLGCVLYECLVGQPPFRRDSELALVFAHLEEAPPVASAARPELATALDDVIGKAPGEGSGRPLSERPRARPGGARGRRGRGEPAAWRRRFTGRSRPQQPQRRRIGARRQGDRPPDRAGAGASPDAAAGGKGHLSVQGPRQLRAGRRGIVLRPRAPRLRARRPTRRPELPRDRRSVGER
jgi:serine/threonine protein kinase